MGLKIQHVDNQTLLSWQFSPSDVSVSWFEPKYWQQQQKIYAQKEGRGTTWFFEHEQTKGVLRHYWRGGMVAKCLQDQYLYLGLNNTRVYKEFRLLRHMHKKGLNVPFPIAAHIVRSGLVYRGNIITGAIPGAQSLLDMLKKRRLHPDEINLVSECIANFHQQGVYHADLNINNILFSRYHKVFLIDFDRCELKPPDQSWQQKNIARLQRSFAREAQRYPELNWQPEDWDKLVACYERKM
jgi:3-deoxy-D-manno-octulosonic acid kinase